MAIHFNIFGKPCHDCGYGDWIYYTINQDGLFLLHEKEPVFKDGKWSIPFYNEEEMEFGTGYLWDSSPVPIPENFDSSKALFKLSKNTLTLTEENYLSLSEV
jgi:hypothetical protein